MAYLGNPAGTMEVVKKYNLSIQKKFGQNFLISEDVLTKIVDAAEVTGEDCVLEIGPGIGTLTQYLAERAREVIAVEIDKALIPILADTLSAYDNVTVINKDILKVDIAELAREKNNGKPFKVVANLPYYITTPIIMKLFEEKVPISSVTVMVQMEVADRMKEGPGSKDYGALSVAVQYYSEPELITVVPPSCFIPQPGVDSAVIKLSKYETLPIQVQDENFFFKIVRAAFGQRRKTLPNSVSHGSGLGLGREEVVAALEQMGLPETVRGEVLTLEEFAKLADLLYLSHRTS